MSSRLIPSLRYVDAPKAIEFLTEAFGFEAHLVVEDTPGRVDHAQLTFGTGMLMLGSVTDNEYGALVTTTGEAGRPTAGLYVIVDDVDGHAERARREGAQIVTEPADQDYGGRLYTCLDLEGNVWSFGDYDPWTAAEP